MTKTAIIGLGYWGKIIFSKLQTIDCDCLVINKDKNLRDYSFKDIDWVFITTPNETHYGLVKEFLSLNVNIFCEKPFTESVEKSNELYDIAKAKNKSIYISDIENYKNHKININKENFIVRNKYSLNKKDVLNRLAYHDFTYLYKFIKNEKLKNIKIIDSKDGILSFERMFQNTKYNFKYNLNENFKCHLFNNNNLTSNSDVITLMIKSVVEKKVDFKLNKEISLFASKFIEKIQREIDIFY